MEKAVKAMLFCEFHDILPGTMIEKGEEDFVRRLEYGHEIVFNNSVKAFFELCKGQRKANDGELPVMVFNPNPYPLETEVEVDFNLQNQNWTDDEVTIAHISVIL